MAKKEKDNAVSYGRSCVRSNNEIFRIRFKLTDPEGRD